LSRKHLLWFGHEISPKGSRLKGVDPSWCCCFGSF
jgi:hypothetical protein